MNERLVAGATATETQISRFGKKVEFLRLYLTTTAYLYSCIDSVSLGSYILNGTCSNRKAILHAKRLIPYAYLLWFFHLCLMIGLGIAYAINPTAREVPFIIACTGFMVKLLGFLIDFYVYWNVGAFLPLAFDMAPMKRIPESIEFEMNVGNDFFKVTKTQTTVMGDTDFSTYAYWAYLQTEQSISVMLYHKSWHRSNVNGCSIIYYNLSGFTFWVTAIITSSLFIDLLSLGSNPNLFWAKNGHFGAVVIPWVCAVIFSYGGILGTRGCFKEDESVGSDGGWIICVANLIDFACKIGLYAMQIGLCLISCCIPVVVYQTRRKHAQEEAKRCIQGRVSDGVRLKV